MRLLSQVYDKQNKADLRTRKVFLEILVRHGFDLTLMSGKGFGKMNKKKYIEGLLAKQNVANFLVFGKVHNRNAQRPLSVARAQSTMQVMFKDVTKFLCTDLGDF